MAKYLDLSAKVLVKSDGKMGENRAESVKKEEMRSNAKQK